MALELYKIDQDLARALAAYYATGAFFMLNYTVNAIINLMNENEIAPPTNGAPAQPVIQPESTAPQPITQPASAPESTAPQPITQPASAPEQTPPIQPEPIAPQPILQPESTPEPAAQPEPITQPESVLAQAAPALNPEPTDQQPVPQPELQAQTTEVKSPKSNKIKIFAIIGGVAAVGIGALILVLTIVAPAVINSINSKNGTIAHHSYPPESFFLRGYIYNPDGEKVTDTSFRRVVESITNGAGVVSNDDYDYALVSSAGEILVDYGVCSTISLEGALFACYTDSNVSLITPKGETIVGPASRSELKIDYFNINGTGDDETRFTVVDYNNKYTFYSYTGSMLASFDKDASYDDGPSVDQDDEYAILNYSNKTVLINADKGEVLTSFDRPEGEAENCIRYINQLNRNQLTLYSCGNGSSYQYLNQYRFVDNGNIVYTKTVDRTSDESLGSGDIGFTHNNVTFSTGVGSETYMLNEKGENAIKTTSYSQFMSYNTYAVTEISDSPTDIDKEGFSVNGNKKYSNGVQLYKNGNKGALLPCKTAFSGGQSANADIYLISGCDSSKNNSYTFYDVDGNIIGDSSYNDANGFDYSRNAKVEIDGAYYLINDKGEKITDGYTKITYFGSHYAHQYLGTKSDNTVDLLSTSGKVLLNSSEIDDYDKRGRMYAIAKREDGYEVYDVDNEKSLATVPDEPTLYDNYFKVKSGDKEYFYSYTTGKMFLEDDD